MAASESDNLPFSSLHRFVNPVKVSFTSRVNTQCNDLRNVIRVNALDCIAQSLKRCIIGLYQQQPFLGLLDLALPSVDRFHAWDDVHTRRQFLAD